MQKLQVQLKTSYRTRVMEDDDDYQPPCPGCSSFLMLPFIQCAECPGLQPLKLCINCFAKGIELKDHESNHKYKVIRNDFAMFESCWTAQEELDLLQAIIDCGIGNWSDISGQVRTKTKQQCENHYYRCYLEKVAAPLPVMKERISNYHPTPIQYKYTEDPPRPGDNSILQQEMSGYMAARGDFMQEYDNYAELDLRDIYLDTEDMEPFERDLKFAVLDVYRNRQKERHRRKKIVRDYGLINIKKIQITNRRYEKALGNVFERFKTLMRLLHPIEFDKYLEGLQYENELRSDIRHLQEYREAGITNPNAATVYEKLKQRRDESKGQKHLLADLLARIEDEKACQQWLHRQALLDTAAKGIPVALPTAPRRIAPPLEIATLPGYDRLTDNERELCSLVRLVPESYLEFKHMLMAECHKHGYLKLAQARNMIKIDVNKTRKIYDFLITERFINKDYT